MINVNVYIKKDIITGLEITGHANAAKKGHDIYCASMSMLFQTTHYSLIEMCNVNVASVVLEGDCKCFLDDEAFGDSKAQFVLSQFKHMSLMLQSDFPEYYKVNLVEHAVYEQ